MSWSGGTFTRSNGTYTGSTVWAQDEANSFDIESARHDLHDQDLATGINTCLAKDGQNTPTANLPMAGYKHTGAGNASASGEYVNYAQFAVSTWTPTLTPQAGAASSTTVVHADYFRINKFCFIQAYITWTQGTSGAAYIDITLPVTPGKTNQTLPCMIIPSGNLVTGFSLITSVSGNGTLRCYAYDQASIATGAGKQLHISGVYVTS